MSGARKYTERDLILAKREAVKATIGHHSVWRHIMNSPLSWGGLQTVVNDLYPLPKVERPRVVDDPTDVMNAGTQFRVSEGRLEVRTSRGLYPDWERFELTGHWTVTPERAKVWADLFDNPTEVVEDEEP